MKYGYRDNDNKTVELNSLEDLIGKKLERFTIIGIFENPSFKEGGVSKDYIVKKYGKEETYVNENLPDYNPLEGYFIIGNNVYSSFNETNAKNEYMGTSDGVYITLPKDGNESLKLLNELNKEKGVIIEEINMSEDTPEDVSYDLSAKAFYGDEGYGRTILGTVSNIKKFNKECNFTCFKK